MRTADHRSIGRHDELSTLEAAARRARSGMGSLVLISGDPGIGKTTLLADFSIAVMATTPVFRVGSHWAEGTPPYWPWTKAIRQLISGVDQETLAGWTTGLAQWLSPVLPELEQLADDTDRVADPEFAQLRFFDSMTRFLAAAADHDPFVILFEDLHWADGPTLQLLGHVARELDRLPAMIVVSYRETEMAERPDGPGFRSGVVRLPATVSLNLRGLDDAQTEALIKRLTRHDGEVPAVITRRLTRFTGGNPFFSTELIDHIAGGATGDHAVGLLAAAADDRRRLHVPDSLRDLAEKRLEKLSFECFELLRIAAVLGPDMDLSTLHAVSDLSAGETDKFVTEATRARLLEPFGNDRYGFSHSMFRETIVQTTSPEWIAEVHLRIAQMLEDRPDLADERDSQLAYHYSEAALAGAQVDRALSFVVAAGNRAMANLAYDRAHEHYELARRVLASQPDPDPVQDFDLVMAACRALAAAGHRKRRNETALEASRMADTIADPVRYTQAALAYQGRGLEAGIVDEQSVALLRRGLAGLPDEGAETERALALARLAQELHFARDPHVTELTAQALSLAEELDDPLTLGQVLRTRHASLRGPGDIDERIATSARMVRLADRAGDLSLRLGARLRHAVDLLEASRPGDFALVLDTYTSLADESGIGHFRWWASVLAASRELLYGRLDHGAEMADAAYRVGEQHAQELAGVFRLIQKVPAGIHRGGTILLEPEFRRVVDAYPAMPAWRAGLALMYLEAGRLVEARAEYQNVLIDGVAKIPVDGNWLQALDFLAQICAALGDHEHAAVLYETLVPCAGRMVAIGRGVGCNGAIDRSLGLLAGVLGRRDDAREHFEAAIELNARMGARPFVAWARLNLAELLVDSGAPTELDHARRLLDAALVDAHELDLTELSSRVVDLAERVAMVTELIRDSDRFERSITSPDGTITVLVTDLVGSTQMQHSLGDRPFFGLLERHNDIVRRAVADHRGVEIKHTGDGIMAGFNSPQSAVAAARRIQSEITDQNRRSAEAILVRIGVNAGRAIIDGHDVFGLAVTAACRICDHAADGQVLVSEAVHRNCDDTRLDFRRIDDVHLKGFDTPIVVFSVS